MLIYFLKEFDKRLQHPVHTMLLYHPFEHSEDLSMQLLGIKKFEEMLQNMDPSDAGYHHTEQGLKFSQDHQEVIAKFGRFPHRFSLFLHRTIRIRADCVF